MVGLRRIIFTLATVAWAALLAQPSIAAITTNITVPFSEIVTNPCNGDPTNVAGLVHLLATTTSDTAGIQTHVQFNELQARDTDLVTQVVCVDTGNLIENGFNFAFSLPPGSPGVPTGDLPITTTVAFPGGESCPGGSSGSYTFLLLAHVTVNPDLSLTVFFDNGGVTNCR